MKVMVVDDEPLARDRLVRLVDAIEGCCVVGQAGNGEQAIAEAEKLLPELVLMDVRMPGMDGLAAAQYLAELDPPPAVIFCTAYDDYAVEAFTSQATGYLLKPIKRVELAKAVERSKRINKAQLLELPEMGEENINGREYVAAKNRRGIDLIALSDIRLFQADHKYVTAYHVDGEALLDETLKELEGELGQRFFRIHRNALVSIEHILGLDRGLDGQYVVKLSDIDIRPQVSRRHVTILKKKLGEL